MIRKLLNGDIDRVADIWLKTNLKTHYFISNQYWKSNYELVKEMMSQSEVYVFEMSLNALMSKIKPLKYKPSPKYPGISKDMAFILDKNTTAGEVMAIIKRAGGRLLDSVSVFDVYTGENIVSDKKSIAFTLNFINPERTLTDEEVMEVFNKIILEVTTKLNCELRDK